MRVIFLEDVPGSGRAGDVKEVKNGYARNFLLPRKLAAPATHDHLQRIEILRKAADVRRVKEEKDLTALAEHLSEVSITLTAKIAPTGRFYGAITSSMIADELARLTEREINRRTINLAEPIHEPGEQQVEVQMAHGITATIQVTARAEGAEEEEPAAEAEQVEPVAEAEQVEPVAEAEQVEPTAEAEQVEPTAEPSRWSLRRRPSRTSPRRRQRKPRSRASHMYVGERLPPHDEPAEESVLGSLLIDGDAILQIPFLKQEDFYRERNRWAYEACRALFERSEAINQVTVAHELATKGRLEEMGGAAVLSHLVAGVPTSVHIEHYAHIVNRTATMRNLIEAATDIAALGYQEDADTDGTLSEAEDLLFKVRAGRETRGFVSIRQVLDKYLEDTASITGPLERGTAPIQTGYVDLDQLLGGLQRSDLIILAARPSFGKSTLALNIARNAAGSGAVVGIFSMEMSREQLVLRMLASEASVDSHRLRLGVHRRDEEQRLLDSVGALSDLEMYIDDSPLQTVAEIRSKSRRLHLEQGVDLLIVDYLQLMQGVGRQNNRVQELSDITRSLKGLARDLNIPLVAISQLSRATEHRATHRPQLSDLRDSGSIEQDADVVAFIYRDDMVYSQDEWERSFPDNKYPKNIAEIIVAKHRNGPLSTLRLFFRDQVSRFENFAAQGAA